MKKMILGIVLTAVSINANADINGNGYYRVKNYGSSRWANLVDNHATVDFIANTADLHSLQLTKETDLIISEPGSVVYLTNISKNQYNVASQGTSLGDLVNNVLYIKEDGTTSDGQQLYRIYGVQSGVTKYIGDANVSDTDIYGKASINVRSSYPNNNKWEIIPIDVDSENYFGVTPSVIANEGKYTTLYASFGFEPYSLGVSAYYIGRVERGLAEMIEINRKIPANAPVIIECAGDDTESNKLDINDAVYKLDGNALSGVYFDYTSAGWNNYVSYNPQTMRVLGTCADGSLGFVVSNITTIPANSAYLIVPQGSPSEIKCVSSEEFNSGVETITDNSVGLRYDGNAIYTSRSADITVYNMSGEALLKGFGNYLDLNGLPKGFYVAVSNGETIKLVR